MYVAYLYFKYLGQTERAQTELDQFNAVFLDYIASLSTELGGAGLIISSQSYRTFPLNPDATPYSSIKGGSNPLDDSDIE